MKIRLYILIIISISGLLTQCQLSNKESKLKIAYNVLVDANTHNYDIHIMDESGDNVINITNNKGVDWVYSGYKDKLYLVSDRDTCSMCYFLYETDTKGNTWRKISETQIQDSWVSLRNNGKELIIKPVGDANTAFQIIDLNGRLIREVDPGLEYFNDPCFSPDGRSIVFRGYDGPVTESYKSELYIYNIETKALQKLTNYPADAKPFGHYQYYAGPPRWNDKYGKISYSSSQNNASQIKSITPNTNEVTSLTYPNTQAVWHDISEDGKSMVYDGQMGYTADSMTSQIFIMDFANRNTIRLTNGKGFKQGPVFLYED